MSSHFRDWILGIFGGTLLAFMIHYNGLVGKQTTPLLASWIAHGTGAVIALLFVVVQSFKHRNNQQNFSQKKLKIPFWYFLGGIPGALTVILATMTVNSFLTLSGTVALLILGQVFFGMISDSFGLLGIKKRKMTLPDLYVAIIIVAGSGLVIFGRS